MKRVVMIASVVVLFLVLGMSFANAQSMEPAEVAAAQDSYVSDNPHMMQDDYRGMGMMGGHHMGMMPGDMMEARHHIMRMMRQLGLDQKQMEAVHEIVDRTAKDLIKKKANFFSAKIDLEDILHREPVDMNAVESQLKQIEAMKTDMFMTHLKSMEEIKALLTPEQRSKLKEMREMHMMGGKGMMEGKKPYHEEKKMMK